MPEENKLTPSIHSLTHSFQVTPCDTSKDLRTKTKQLPPPFKRIVFKKLSVSPHKLTSCWSKNVSPPFLPTWWLLLVLAWVALLPPLIRSTQPKSNFSHALFSTLLLLLSLFLKNGNCLTHFLSLVGAWDVQTTTTCGFLSSLTPSL